MSKQRPRSPQTAARCCRPIDKLLDARLFKALGDETRLLLVSCLAKCGRPCTVTEVAACCEVDFSVVSRHLLILQQAGVLDVQRSGRTVSYIVRFSHLAASLAALSNALESCAGDSAAARQPGCCDAC